MKHLIFTRIAFAGMAIILLLAGCPQTKPDEDDLGSFEPGRKTTTPQGCIDMRERMGEDKAPC